MPATLVETRDAVSTMLADFVGRVELGAGGQLSFVHEGSRVFVDVRSWGDNSSLVQVYSVTNVELTPTPELYEYVALHSDDWIFGHLGMAVNEGNAIVHFSHTLLGDFLDEDELRTAVFAVAVTASQIDDQIEAQFGGRRPEVT